MNVNFKLINPLFRTYVYTGFFILMKKSTLEFYPSMLDTQNEKTGTWTDYTMWHSLNKSMV